LGVQPEEAIMADFILPVFFSGLIAFVPGSGGHPESMTAYMLNTLGDHCLHTPTINVVGCMSVIKNSHACAEHDGVIACILGETDIILDPPPVESMRYLKAKPGTHIPSALDDGENIAWLVDVSNLGGGTRSLKNNIDGLYRSRFRFGWDEAKTCLLDEIPNAQHVHAVHSFEFCPLDEDQIPNCAMRSTHQQAVAESVLFKLRLTRTPIRLILRDRGAVPKETIVELRCPSGLCPLISIGNDISGMGCDDENAEYGRHFANFYRLLRDGGEKGMFVPHRIDESIEEALVSANCGRSGYVEKLKSVCNIDLFQVPEGRSNDRVICPPALIDP
jgi:hypothetical protein